MNRTAGADEMKITAERKTEIKTMRKTEKKTECPGSLRHLREQLSAYPPEKERSAGILMPIFSLPGKYGIGSFGQEARDFADFLCSCGQSYWQILPLGPTGYGDSPYQSFSTFAGNPYFIDLPILISEGLLTEAECDGADFGSDARKIDYVKLYEGRYPLLRNAFERFMEKGWDRKEEYLSFCEKNAYWLDGYAAFMEKNMPGYSAAFHRFLQFCFGRQWNALKGYCHERGIGIIGDIPIYVSGDSSDVSAEPGLFQLDEDGNPTQVAGCPPDAFAATGQLWGNPLYDWEYHKKTGFAWWIQRMRQCLERYDIVRVDHFRGFDSYYAIPYGDKDATGGHWEEGPGIALFRTMERELHTEGKVIAEDLGFITESVKKLVQDSGFPSMKVLEFSFDSRDESNQTPDLWEENAVAYTGTHDNQTLAAWISEIGEEDREMVCRYIGIRTKDLPETDYVGKLIEATMKSRCSMAVISMQDYLRRGKEARVNTPSTLGGNWEYRFLKGDFTENCRAEIRKQTEESRRWSRKS